MMVDLTRSTSWNVSCIERAGMNGQDRTSIVLGDRVKWPNALEAMNKVARPMTVRIYNKEAQPMVANKCSEYECEEMCLPLAVHRENTKEAERTWIGRPYACLCQGNTPVDMLECAVQIASDTTTGVGSSFRSLILFLLLAVVSCIVASFVGILQLMVSHFRF